MKSCQVIRTCLHAESGQLRISLRNRENAKSVADLRLSTIVFHIAGLDSPQKRSTDDIFTDALELNRLHNAAMPLSR